jgi:hypothetical protein
VSRFSKGVKKDSADQIAAGFGGLLEQMEEFANNSRLLRPAKVKDLIGAP